MKKIYTLFLVLLAVSWQYATAQQTQVADLNGNYVCLTPGVPGGLNLHVNGSAVELEFCPNVIENNCITYSEVHPTVTNGEIMARSAEPGNPPVAWQDVRFTVEEVQGKAQIKVIFADGIDYLFERQ